MTDHKPLIARQPHDSRNHASEPLTRHDLLDKLITHRHAVGQPLGRASRSACLIALRPANARWRSVTRERNRFARLTRLKSVECCRMCGRG